jgi:hypothetical protein
VAAGATVIAVAGGPEKAARCAALGADLVIDHTAGDFVEAVLAATGDAGAEVVYDLADGDFAERCWRCTAHGGRYLAVGFADDEANGMTGRPLRMACIGNIDIVGVMLAWVAAVDPGMRRFGFNPFGRDVADEIHADLLRLAAEGTIRPVIGQRAAAGVQRDRDRAEPAGVRAPALTCESVLAGAVKAAGHDDFGSDSYREPLDVFVTACRDQAELTPFGRFLVTRMLQRALANRLSLQGWAAGHPEVRAQAIAGPWVIVGLPRTGTSILDMLLGLHPRARPLLQWEAAHPVPPVTQAEAADDTRITQTARELDRLMKLNPVADE